LLVYARHPFELALALLLSLGNHCLVILGVWAMGRAYGADAEGVALAKYFAIVPVADMVSALPIAPAGWGVGEAMYQYLFQMVGASGTLGVAVSATYRVAQMLIGLAGGLFLLAPKTRARMDAARAAGTRGVESGAPERV
jgi:uncharacterized membrane protein YbhN (UPF0104 family)